MVFPVSIYSFSNLYFYQHVPVYHSLFVHLYTFTDFLTFWLHRVEREKSQAADPTKVSAQKKAEEVKAQLEAQLKQQRLAAQQVWM